MSIVQPGPELNKYIHERLFGKDLTGYEWPKHASGKSMVKQGNGFVWWEDIPEYSTTWSGMQLVVEEMQRRGWSFTLQRYGDDNGEKSPWEATFGYMGDEPGAIEETAPHAVCMAALSALEGQADD